jgi:hypothetical protein
MTKQFSKAPGVEAESEFSLKVPFPLVESGDALAMTEASPSDVSDVLPRARPSVVAKDVSAVGVPVRSEEAGGIGAAAPAD